MYDIECEKFPDRFTPKSYTKITLSNKSLNYVLVIFGLGVPIFLQLMFIAT